MQITNTQKGPRGVNAASGHVLIEPGQSADLKLSKAELKVAKATGWFEFGEGAEDDDGPPVAGELTTVDEVLAMADTVPFMTFKAAASKLLADGTPGSKADIVAALTAIKAKG